LSSGRNDECRNANKPERIFNYTKKEKGGFLNLENI
jgi:hypothetical protein